MRAVYKIRTCCGDVVQIIECEVPADCSDPSDYEAEKHVLSMSDYAGHGYCSGCGSQAYQANYVGVPVETVGTVGHLDAENREALILTLEALLKAVRAADDYVSFVELTEEGSRIG